ncbi:type IV secretory system conjugative DNA transfer family protein [Spirosoma endophyticum]|uniref:TraM recognition site of TraD and TraG n=1 Tax=Spirosoma endophyticum TaxID=662367 RepID=A0A1I2HRP3_9BACT|nr:TraM recognition domain-containing protein [Spirosoma endophyticum]SFF32083.1 TraM recognition site of TraD and TraG [Spirosoma endophyticum]
MLSGDDLRLNLNDPDEKKVLVLGNNSNLDEVYSPVLALLASVALKEMNQPGKAESIFMVDEFPTIYLPRFETYPATCRSNGVEVTIGIQDFSQMEERYGRNMKNAIMGTLGNQFFGMQANLESAKYVSELWGKEEVQATSTSQSEATGGTRPGGNTGQSVSLTERQRIKVQDVSNLKQGEFYGKLFQSDFSTFKARIKAVERPAGAQWKPFSQVTDGMIEQNFSRIEADILSLMKMSTDSGTPFPVPVPPSSSNGQALADEF